MTPMLHAVSLAHFYDGPGWAIDPLSGALIREDRGRHGAEPLTGKFAAAWEALRRSDVFQSYDVSSDSIRPEILPRLAKMRRTLASMEPRFFTLARAYAGVPGGMCADAGEAFRAMAQLPDDGSANPIIDAFLAAKVSARFPGEGVLFIGAFPSTRLYAFIVEAGEAYAPLRHRPGTTPLLSLG